MNPRAIIADDEPHLAEYLRTRLAALWPELKIVALAGNGAQALAAIDEHAPNVAFLDIKMPGLTGLEVAERLHGTRDAKTHVVFVTAFDEFAVAAFEREAVDYLLKPVVDERLVHTVARLKERIAKCEAPPEIRTALAHIAQWLPAVASDSGLVAAPRLSWIRAAVGDQVRLIAIGEICYFQANDKYVSVFTREGEALIRWSLREITDQLDPEKFWQIHRSTIVNVAHISTSTRELNGKVQIKLKTRPETLVASRAFAHLFRQM